MQNFGTYNIPDFLPPLAPLSIQTGVSWAYIRIINRSGYQLTVNFSGIGSVVIPEFWLEDYSVPFNFRGNIIITPTIVMTDVAHATAQYVTVNAYMGNEIQSPQAQPLSQAAVNPTATGNPIFTAHQGLGSSSQVVQTLNIFNPANSGTDCTFHSGKVFSNSTGVPQAIVAFISGADLNLATSVTPFCHTVQSNPPTSVTHCTFDQAAVGHGGSVIDNTYIHAPTGSVELLAFPDVVTLKPGNNLLIVCSDGASGFNIMLETKWMEKISIPAPVFPGGIPLLTAANIVNDTSTAGTGIVEARPSGDAQSAVLITNNAQVTFGDTANQALLTIKGREIINGTTSPALDLSGSTGAIGLLLKIGSFTSMSIFTGSATNAGNLQAHSLGVKPDFVSFQETGAAGDANTFVWDIAASDATNVKVWTGNATARTYIALAVAK